MGHPLIDLIPGEADVRLTREVMLTTQPGTPAHTIREQLNQLEIGVFINACGGWEVETGQFADGLNKDIKLLQRQGKATLHYPASLVAHILADGGVEPAGLCKYIQRGSSRRLAARRLVLGRIEMLEIRRGLIDEQLGALRRELQRLDGQHKPDTPTPSNSVTLPPGAGGGPPAASPPNSDASSLSTTGSHSGGADCGNQSVPLMLPPATPGGTPASAPPSLVVEPPKQQPGADAGSPGHDGHTPGRAT